MKDSAILEELAAVQHERDRLLDKVHGLEHDKRTATKSRDRHARQLQMASALNLSIFTAPDTASMYGLLCRGLVYQLHWDGAVVIGMHGRNPVVHAYHGMSEGQIQHIRDYATTNAIFLSQYHTGKSHLTHQRTDTLDLSLRALFSADEVMMAPIQLGDERFAYVITCAHTQRALQNVTEQELAFTSGVAAVVAHAVQYNLSFKNLEDQNHRLRQLDQLKDSFLSITSHQLRTPLSIIKWVLAALQTDPAIQVLEEQHKLVTQAYSTNERLIHVVTELLNVSRIQEGQLHCELRVGNLREVVLDLHERNRPLSENEHVELVVSVPDSVPDTMLDPLLLKEALQNMVNNAIDYCSDNGTISLELTREEDELIVSVTNTGVGIAAEDREKVFTQFFRGENAQRIEPNGNGLGLYMTRVIVEEHGGRVGFVSHPNKTTVFTARFPIMDHHA